jgi:hypothetical protein
MIATPTARRENLQVTAQVNAALASKANHKSVGEVHVQPGLAMPRLPVVIYSNRRSIERN